MQTACHSGYKKLLSPSRVTSSLVGETWQIGGEGGGGGGGGVEKEEETMAK